MIVGNPIIMILKAIMLMILKRLNKVSLNSTFLDLILNINGDNLFVKIGYRLSFYNGRIDNIIYLSYY